MPELITPETLLTMGEEDILSHLSALRERRAIINKRYLATVDKRNKLSKGELYSKINIKVDRLSSALKKADEWLSKCERYINETIALRLQYGDMDMDALDALRGDDFAARSTETNTQVTKELEDVTAN